jgi:hypothetical protein
MWEEKQRKGKEEKRKEEGGKEAHTCNPSYSGGRHQEDHSSKPAQANSLPDPISKKKTFTKKGWWCDSKCRS